MNLIAIEKGGLRYFEVLYGYMSDRAIKEFQKFYKEKTGDELKFETAVKKQKKKVGVKKYNDKVKKYVIELYKDQQMYSTIAMLLNEKEGKAFSNFYNTHDIANYCNRLKRSGDL